jgi:hypothetical protein
LAIAAWSHAKQDSIGASTSVLAEPTLHPVREPLAEGPPAFSEKDTPAEKGSIENDLLKAPSIEAMEVVSFAPHEQPAAALLEPVAPAPCGLGVVSRNHVVSGSNALSRSDKKHKRSASRPRARERKALAKAKKITSGSKNVSTDPCVRMDVVALGEISFAVEGEAADDPSVARPTIGREGRLVATLESSSQTRVVAENIELYLSTQQNFRYRYEVEKQKVFNIKCVSDANEKLTKQLTSELCNAKSTLDICEGKLAERDIEILELKAQLEAKDARIAFFVGKESDSIGSLE